MTITEVATMLGKGSMLTVSVAEERDHIPESREPVKHTDFTPERSIESYGLLDLYSYDAFRTVLHTPRIYEAFFSFLRSEHSEENLVFWSRCQTYRHLHHELTHSASQIKIDHLQEGSKDEINVRRKTRVEGITNVENMLRTSQQTESVFTELQKEVEMLMWRDSYPRFLKHHLAYNASKSLEWYPGKTFTFKGLGECFCITNPRREDNPIELCSDGFIQVTGFPASRIINHNCRFLQGSLSDRATVGRIRIAIKEGKESTEVFLNYRHDGTPFWNLLLVAPLRDETGEIVYFFGAQVDVSSLFQKHNDLSAILSKDFALNEPTASEGRKSFFRRLSEKTRLHSMKHSVMPLTPGLEEEVVRENITTIGEQVDVFRTAYSRYLIVEMDSKIQFCSDAASQLFPSSCLSQPIFPLLQSTFNNIDSRSLKSLQKALHNGQASNVRLTVSPPSTPISDAHELDEVTRSRESSTTTATSVGSLLARKRTGGSCSEAVVSVHMTPLKDGNSKVGKVVFVLATGI